MLKKVLENVFNKTKKIQNNITIKRKEGYDDVGRVTLTKKTSEQYCVEREKRIKVFLTAIGQQ